MNPSQSSRDRTVHATTEDGREIVRYDRAGKWYWENADHRKHIELAEAVRLACLSGSHIRAGQPGGGRFDAAVRDILLERMGRHG